jgi:hypothetical protein
MQPDAASVEEVKRLRPQAMALMLGWLGFFAIFAAGVIGVNMAFKSDFEKRSGPILTQVSATRVSPRDLVVVKMGFRAHETLSINGAELALIGLSHRAGSHQRHIYAWQRLERHSTVSAGGVFEETVGLVIPADIPVNANPEWTGINYDLIVTLDLPRRPDWSRTFRLEVRPRAGVPTSATPH